MSWLLPRKSFAIERDDGGSRATYYDVFQEAETIGDDVLKSWRPMPEVVRVYNREPDKIDVMVEPWGTWYEVPKEHYLSIHVDTTVGLIEIEQRGGTIRVFLNDAIFDDLTTDVKLSKYI